MATKSSIEWTEMTWNPVTGCTKISQGCKHCYAERLAIRLQAIGISGYEDGFTSISLQHNRLQQPLHRRIPTMYFVNSMSDLFHEDVPDSYITQVLKVISEAKQHSFQILTKRAERMADYFKNYPRPPINAWIGVSVENKEQGIPRIALLRTVPAKIRFLSIEPLLEDLGRFSMKGINWVIVGGESGPKARPMDPVWVEKIRKQCERSSVPFFFKQWGAWGEDGIKRSKKKNGRKYKNHIWNEMPAYACI